MLDLPSDLQGSYVYDANILVWLKQSKLNPTICELQRNVGDLVAADTDLALGAEIAV